MDNAVWIKGEYQITTNKDDLDFDFIFRFLTKESYWSKGISKEDVGKSIDHSTICFGIYETTDDNEKKQIGFARVISDLVTHAYIQDVFIVEGYRKLGLGKWLVETIIACNELKIRRIMLSTDDAHSFYSKFGFEKLDKPEFFMQIKGKGAI